MLSRKLIRRLSIATAISLSVISFRPIKSEAVPAAAAAPAACATGVGCILVGTAVVGGVLVHVWQSSQGTRYHTPVYSRDPGNIPGRQETHYATSAEGCQKMRQRFQQAGRKIRLVRIKPVKDGVICIFQGESSQPGYYNDRR